MSLLQKTTKNYKITLVVPVRNEENHLNCFFNAIEKQTNKDFYLFFIDDQSTDNSLKLIKEFALINKNTIKIIENLEHRGIIYSCISSLKYLKTDLVSFISCNDIIHDNFIADVITAHNRYPDQGLSFSNSGYYDGDQLKITSLPFADTCKLTNHEYCRISKIINFSIPSNTVCFKTKFLYFYNTEFLRFGIYSDWLVVRYVAMKYGAIFINNVNSTQRKHSDQYSNSSEHTYFKKVEYIKSIYIHLITNGHFDLFAKHGVFPDLKFRFLIPMIFIKGLKKIFFMCFTKTLKSFLWRKFLIYKIDNKYKKKIKEIFIAK